jgi:hypothetical protein
MATDAWRAIVVALLAAAVPLPALAAAVTLVNAGFESRKAGEDGNPEGWVAIQHAGAESYAFALDDTHRKSGAQSQRITRIGREPYGSIVQMLPGAPYAGRKVRLSAWIRTDTTRDRRGGGAGLVLSAMRDGSFLAHDHMKDSRVSGTTDWKRYTIELALPPATTQLEIGAMLMGSGTMWVDDFELEVVDR